MTAVLDAIRGHAAAGRQNPAFDDGMAAISWAEALARIGFPVL